MGGAVLEGENGAEQATTEIENSDIVADSVGEKGRDDDNEQDSVSESNPSSSTKVGLYGAAMLLLHTVL